MELFAIPVANRVMYYVAVPVWWREIEVSSLLVVPSPSVFAYYSNRVFSGTPRQVETIWRIARSEWEVMAVILFLAACRDGVGVVLGAGWDPRLANSGIIVPLPRRMVELIERLNFFQVVRSSEFDAELSFLAYCRTRKVDWSRHSMR